MSFEAVTKKIRLNITKKPTLRCISNILQLRPHSPASKEQFLGFCGPFTEAENRAESRKKCSEVARLFKLTLRKFTSLLGNFHLSCFEHENFIPFPRRKHWWQQTCNSRPLWDNSPKKRGAGN